MSIIRFATSLIRVSSPLLIYIALTIVFTWPLSSHLTTAVGYGADPLLQTWVLAWNAHAFLTNPQSIWNAPIFYPYPETLAYSDHHLLLTAIALPWIISGGPVLAYNLLVMLSYVLTGWAIYLLTNDILVNVRDSRIRIVGAIFAGALFAFGTYRITHFVHLQLLQTAWLPLALLFLRRLLYRQIKGHSIWVDAVLFGLFTGIQSVTALYYAFFAAFTLGLYTLVWLWTAVRSGYRSDVWKRLGGLLSGLLLAALVAIPLTQPYIRVYEYIGVVRSLRELDNWSAPLQSYLAVAPTNWLYGGKSAWFTASGGEFALFPGFVTIILSSAILILVVWAKIGRGKTSDTLPINYFDAIFLALLAFSACVLSFGTGIRLERGSEVLSVPMPYTLLYEYVPGFGALRVPARWAVLSYLSLSILAGAALVYMVQWLRCITNYRLATVISVIVGMIGLIEHASFPLPLSTIPSPKPVYSWLGTQSDVRAVLELPVGAIPRGADLERIVMRQFLQIYHWKPLVTGYSGVVPFGTIDVLRQIQRLPDDETIRFLALIGVDTLIIHRDEFDPEKLTHFLAWADNTLLLQRRAEIGDALIYTITPQANPSLPVMKGASVFVSSDERVPGIIALGLIQRLKAEGALLYGSQRTRYYPGLRNPQAGQVFDYGLLATDEDPLRYGFDAQGGLLNMHGLVLYARDPGLRAAIDLAQPVPGQFHPTYPSQLTVTVETDRIVLNDKVLPLSMPLTRAFLELDVVSLVSQTITVDENTYIVAPGATTIVTPVAINQPTFITGQADTLNIQRMRVLEELRTIPPPERQSLAITAQSRFDGSRLLIDARIGGTGVLILEVRGASLRDDRPIHLLSGVPPAMENGYLSFDVDLLDPAEPWLSHRGQPEDGRYIAYLRVAENTIPAVPIATFFIRDGMIVNANPLILPLSILR